MEFRFSASDSASDFAESTRNWAALNAEAISVIPRGSLRISLRWLLDVSSRARFFARPICPCEACAANEAIAGEIFSDSNNFVTAATDGVRKTKLRVLDRIVGSTSERVGAQSNQIVLAPGSSIAFSSALAADSVRRSASSIITTRYCATEGIHEALATNSLTSSILIESPSVLTSSTSTWEPFKAVVQSTQLLQPEFGHNRAAANASAALLLPEPGGPVNNQAWTISCDSSLLSLAAATADLRMATVEV